MSCKKVNLISKIRYILAILLAFVAPGMGRAITGEIVIGTLLYVIYDVLSHFIVITEPHWMNTAFSLVLWMAFALGDLKYVVQSYMEETRN